MRGDGQRTSHLFSHLSPEQRVPANHRLRRIRIMTDDAVRRVSQRFEALYASTVRPTRAVVARVAAVDPLLGAQ